MGFCVLMEYTVRFSFISDWIIEQLPKPLPFRQQLSSFVTHYRVHSNNNKKNPKKVETETILIWRNLFDADDIIMSARLLNECEILENFNG